MPVIACEVPHCCEHDFSALFRLFRRERYPFWLDSSSRMHKEARYSHIGADPIAVWRWAGPAKGSRMRDEEFLKGIDSISATVQGVWQSTEGMRVTLPALVGWLTYEFGARMASCTSDSLSEGAEEVGSVLALYDSGVTIDHNGRVAYLWALPLASHITSFLGKGNPAAGTMGGRRGGEWARERLRELQRRWDLWLSGGTDEEAPREALAAMIRGGGWSLERHSYLWAVRRIKEYIRSGEIYQANLTRRLRLGWAGDPFVAYTRLRQSNPEPYAAFLEFPETVVACASPELFLSVEGGEVITRPIKGTRRRGQDPASDEFLQRELYSSEKDRAELLMIVDLERNDLGRVCETGSITVPEVWGIESHPKVHHLVATVKGRLRKGVKASELLVAMLPGGSITGAPKIRAIEIIREVEPVPRGIYTGCLGYYGYDGSLKLNIVIRSLFFRQGYVDLQVGGGVVADSEPEAEYEETLHKSAGLLEAIGAASAFGSWPNGMRFQ